MRFKVNDPNEIRWMRDPEEYEVGEVVNKLKAANKWDELLEIEQDEEGVVDCDALYDYLRHDGATALLSVGLHSNEAVATVQEVVAAWAKEHAEEGLKVSYCADGKTPSGLQLFDYGPSGIDLVFESVNADGETEEVDLDSDEVLGLVGDMANGNATEGAWTCTDTEHATFEMWRGLD